MIRLIATDIDGTLLHDQQDTLNPAYFEVIQNLQKKGIYFCAASGRQYSSLKKLFGPAAKDMIYITQNGSDILYQNKNVFSRPMTMEASRQLVLDTRAIPGAQSMYCTGDTAYFEEGDWEVYQLMKEEYHFNCKMVPDLLNLDFPCVKFSLYLKEQVNEITGQEFTPKWKLTHDVACGGAYFMDVMERNVNKGMALRKVLKMFGVSPEETMVFGDNHNDLEMMSEAKYSYAVANARTAVKTAAAYETASNNEDGVLMVLKKLLNELEKENQV